MTRRSILILCTVLISLFAARAIPISADTPCESGGDGRCVVVSVSNDAAVFHVQDVTSPAQTPETRAIYRVSDSYYYAPAPGGMWVVIHYQADGAPVIEDYVTGSPPANSVAVTVGTYARDTSCVVVSAPCDMP